MIILILMAAVIGVAIGFAVAKIPREDRGRAQMRHDLRGALTPALLAAEMLEAHADPVVKQRSVAISEAIGRAQQILQQDAGRR